MSTKTTHYELIKPADNEKPNNTPLNANMDIIDSELYTRAKSWNGITPNSSGDIQATTIALAENLNSSSNQTSEGTFQARATGGSASVGGSNGTLMRIQGYRVRTGYSPASFTMTITMAARGESDPDIDATLDEDEFAAAASGSGTYTFSYTTGWSIDPSTYGITVTGTPLNGDSISVVYVAEVLGTIVQSNPSSFISTGWNLYNYLTGYARVVRYSETYGYCIRGTYSAIYFSETQTGQSQQITPSSTGLFTVPSDGWIRVVNGTNTTAIWATWSDWVSAPGEEIKPYSESVVDFSAIMASYFPNGLMQVGSYRDEINLETGVATSVIERMANNSTNMETAESRGTEYEYDGSYIYSVRTAAVTNNISLVGTYTADDHGLEIIDGGTIGATVRTMYGANLKNKLERDVVTISKQTLNDDQMKQVRDNIGAVSQEEFASIDLGIWKVQGLSICTSKNVAGNSYDTLTATPTAIPGFKPVGVLGWSATGGNSTYLLVRNIYLKADGVVTTTFRNTSSNAITLTMSANVLYFKE